MTGNVHPASELTFNELQAADIVLSYDDGAGEYLYRDGITGREIDPGELIPVPDPESEFDAEAEAEAEAEWADEWDSADSHAYMDRVEAGLEPEAEL